MTAPSLSRDIGHPIFARVYAALASGSEERGTAGHRQQMLAGLQGDVVEIGAGSGLNFAHYPQSVAHVTAIEPEPHLRRLAEAAAATAHVAVTVSAGTAEALPLTEDSCDAVVFSLVLCSVAVQGKALAEARRVLKSGGELRFYEHVAARNPNVFRAQRAADATFWPHLAGGCHLARDTARAIRQAGFHIERIERFAYSPARLLPAAPHILGSARAPT